MSDDDDVRSIHAIWLQFLNCFASSSGLLVSAMLSRQTATVALHTELKHRAYKNRFGILEFHITPLVGQWAFLQFVGWPQFVETTSTLTIRRGCRSCRGHNGYSEFTVLNVLNFPFEPHTITELIMLQDHHHNDEQVAR